MLVHLGPGGTDSTLHGSRAIMPLSVAQERSLKRELRDRRAEVVCNAQPARKLLSFTLFLNDQHQSGSQGTSCSILVQCVSELSERRWLEAREN